MTQPNKHDLDNAPQEVRDFVDGLRKFASKSPREEALKPAPKPPTAFSLDGHGSTTITTLGGHGLSEGDKIVFTTTGSLPKGLRKPLWKRALDRIGLKTKDRVFTVGKVHRVGD